MRWTVTLFALRVPLSCVLALALLAPLGAFSYSPFLGMLEGLFDVSPWGAFWVAMASWLSAAACWICSLLALNYGPRRMPGLKRTTTDLEFRLFPGLAAAYSLAPLSLLSGVCAVSADWPGVAAGSFTGCGAALAGWLIHRGLFSRFRWGNLVLHWDPAGYRDDSTGHLLPGHWLAGQFTAFFLVLWALIGLLKYMALSDGKEMVALPTSLTYLVLLIGLMALLFSGLAFFFDRYRVPVLLPWLALLAIASAFPSADQFFETSSAPSVPLLQPVDLMKPERTPVLVCASGGGIAAAAWTATVLTSLERRNPGRLQSSMVLFSGASGGSVGGMHFVSACRSSMGCGAAVERASRSSLDAAAWGLVGPDLLRAIVPFAGRWLGDAGRGWALEQTWDPSQSLRCPLSTWVPKPAVVFNATVVETGEGVALGNVDLGDALPGFRSLLRNASQKFDLSPVTAARLSASFPFVTPTPRPRAFGFHFADGGYYDNYGVGAAVAFLDRAYRLPAGSLPRQILLIEIRASRSSSNRTEPVAGAGMLFQWWSPARTMINVRDTEQRRRNDATLSLLSEVLAARGAILRRVVFEIPSSDVPLSWHLTAKQIAGLARDWRERFESSPETRAVADFLAQRR